MKDVPKTIEAVWKIESTRLIAAIALLTCMVSTSESAMRRESKNSPDDIPGGRVKLRWSSALHAGERFVVPDANKHHGSPPKTDP
jgi:hypothetical protein